MFETVVRAVMTAGMLGAGAAAASAAVDVPEVTTGDLALLSPLRREHPRLVALDEDVSRTRELVRRDPLARQWHEQLRNGAEQLLKEPPVQHVLAGPRLLHQSRAALLRIYHLGLLHRLDGDRRYVERAEKELLAVCAFPDWNPSHFLDTAEMAHAVAIGYDWFYADFSPETRAALRSGLVRLGLEPGMKVYREKRWWVVGTNNWNQVCNGGLMLGALAIADEEPEIAAFILREGRKSLPHAMAEFAPDGGWIEGPGYWSYTTRYCAYLFAGLHSALGTAFGLDESPGFPRTGLFPVVMTGPTGHNFNWGDGSAQSFSAPQLFWLARRFDQPLCSWAERRLASGGPEALDLLWLQPEAPGPKATGLALDWKFDGIHVATMREKWEEPRASFAGFKGGFGHAPHANLDLGTFVFDTDGHRWAIELGADDYNLPGYFNRKKRYTYYRNGTPGQNTLTLDGKNQEIVSTAPLTAFRSGESYALAVSDLTSGYRQQAKEVRRGVALCGERRHLLVQDEWESTSPVEYQWTMHTRATAELSGPQALLRQGEETLRARILQPEGARFEVISAEQKAPENENRGIRRLVVRLPEKTTSATVAVLLSPGSAPEYRPEVAPLAEWKRGTWEGKAAGARKSSK